MATDQKFECHLTFDKTHRAVVQTLRDDWKFSEIDGDALMGAKSFCYLTAYDTKAHRLLDRAKAVEQAAKQHGAEALRCKIEEIVYDTRTGINRI